MTDEHCVPKYPCVPRTGTFPNQPSLSLDGPQFRPKEKEC